jgi:hypothetical protein
VCLGEEIAWKQQSCRSSTAPSRAFVRECIYKCGVSGRVDWPRSVQMCRLTSPEIKTPPRCLLPASTSWGRRAQCRGHSCHFHRAYLPSRNIRLTFTTETALCHSMRSLRHIGMTRRIRNENGQQCCLLSLADLTTCNAALHLRNPNRSLGCAT